MFTIAGLVVVFDGPKELLAAAVLAGLWGFIAVKAEVAFLLMAMSTAFYAYTHDSVAAFIGTIVALAALLQALARRGRAS
jgi:hypothetical protein